MRSASNGGPFALPGRAWRAVMRVMRAPTESQLAFEDLANRTAALHERMDAFQGAQEVLHADLRALRTDAARRAAAAEHRAAVDRESADRTAATVAALTAQVLREGVPSSNPSTCRVSVVLPCRDRAEQLRTAIESVRAQTHQHWELLVVDDRSEPPLSDQLGSILDDERIVVIRSEGSGVAAARNAGLRAATGDVIAFLDSDNWWLPRRLERALADLGDAPWGFDQQLVVPEPPREPFVRNTAGAMSSLRRGNFLDVGVLLVRRTTLDQLLRDDGATWFDASLDRLGDWDFALRLADRGDPVRSASLQQVYDDRGDDRITRMHPYGPSQHRILSRRLGRPAEGLRILLAEWHFPQVTESYIQADIAGLRALGAEVEVWAEEKATTVYEPGVPWRCGELRDHLQDFQPDLVLTHWLHKGLDNRDVVRGAGIPYAVRSHSFDFKPEFVEELASDPGVIVHLFSHHVDSIAPRPNVVVDPVAFDPERIRPTADKDRRMVLRLAAGLMTKDIETFLLASKHCPELRFVLVLGRAHNAQERTDELIRMAADTDAKVEIVTDLGYAEAAELTMRAGIYAHTHGTDHPLGSPISPVEAMASGSLVLVRGLPGHGYVGDGALVYDGRTPEERARAMAAILNDTLHWSEERWKAQAHRALDRAWTTNPADLVCARLLDRWRERFGL